MEDQDVLALRHFRGVFEERRKWINHKVRFISQVQGSESNLDPKMVMRANDKLQKDILDWSQSMTKYFKELQTEDNLKRRKGLVNDDINWLKLIEWWVKDCAYVAAIYAIVKTNFKSTLMYFVSMMISQFMEHYIFRLTLNVLKNHEVIIDQLRQLIIDQDRIPNPMLVYSLGDLHEGVLIYCLAYI